MSFYHHIETVSNDLNNKSIIFYNHVKAIFFKQIKKNENHKNKIDKDNDISHFFGVECVNH